MKIIAVNLFLILLICSCSSAKDKRVFNMDGGANFTGSKLTLEGGKFEIIDWSLDPESFPNMTTIGKYEIDSSQVILYSEYILYEFSGDSSYTATEKKDLTVTYDIREHNGIVYLLSEGEDEAIDSLDGGDYFYEVQCEIPL